MWELPSPPRSGAVLSDTAGTAPTLVVACSNRFPSQPLGTTSKTSTGDGFCLNQQATIGRLEKP